MSHTATLAEALPVLQPEDAGARLLLFGVRQMGRFGVDDACAAHAFVTAFGKDFRRPLVLLRALMTEMAHASSAPIPIAPWCCARMTGTEATLLAVLGHVRTNPGTAGLLLADMLGVRDASAVLATAAAVSQAFADLGLTLERE
jgi:hypothetical protein